MTIPYAVPAKPQLFGSRHALDMIAGILLWFLVIVSAVVAALPVLLLFVNTAVPFLITLLLVIFDLILVFLLVRKRHAVGLALLALLGMVVVGVTAVALSQQMAATPPIAGSDGLPLARSIAVMEKVQLGGSEQWITLRGEDSDKPVLLYLGIGGPGAGGFPASAMNLALLEKEFVVVNWDQPGTGKSYDAVPISTLTVDRFVADAHELTNLMRERFGEEKIYVMGLSWGTIVGIKLVQQYPELFHAYVGNGQMVNTVENDRIGYDFAIQYAREHGDVATVRALERNGPPPYDGEGMAMKYAAYNNVLFRYMNSPTLELILMVAPQFAREYGLVDRVNFARGLLDSFPVLYPQLRELDFEQQAAQLEVPIYFLVGRNDINAVATLVERYYNKLEAPYKELIWVEGGHGATPEQLRDTLVTRVLAESPSQ